MGCEDRQEKSPDGQTFASQNLELMWVNPSEIQCWTPPAWEGIAGNTAPPPHFHPRYPESRIPRLKEPGFSDGVGGGEGPPQPPRALQCPRGSHGRLRDRSPGGEAGARQEVSPQPDLAPEPGFSSLAAGPPPAPPRAPRPSRPGGGERPAAPLRCRRGAASPSQRGRRVLHPE